MSYGRGVAASAASACARPWPAGLAFQHISALKKKTLSKSAQRQSSSSVRDQTKGKTYVPAARREREGCVFEDYFNLSCCQPGVLLEHERGYSSYVRRCKAGSSREVVVHQTRRHRLATTGTKKPGATTSRSCPGSSQAENGAMKCWDGSLSATSFRIHWSRILGRKLSNRASCPRRNYGCIPRRKDHTAVRGVAGGRHCNNTMGDGVVNSCANQNIVLFKAANAHVNNERGVTEMTINLKISQIQDRVCRNRRKPALKPDLSPE